LKVVSFQKLCLSYIFLSQGINTRSPIAVEKPRLFSNSDKTVTNLYIKAFQSY